MVLWEHKRVIDPNSRKIPKKFRSNRHGPFKIVGQNGPNSFILQNPDTEEVIKEAINAEKLRLFNEFFPKEKEEDSSKENIYDEDNWHDTETYAQPHSVGVDSSSSDSDDDVAKVDESHRHEAGSSGVRSNVSGVPRGSGDASNKPSGLKLSRADAETIREAERFLACDTPSHPDQTAYGQKKF